jgi:lysyl endopeptidase
VRRISSCLAGLLAGLLWCASPLHAAPVIDVVTTDIGPLIDEAAKHPNRFAVEVVHQASPDSKGTWSSSGANRTWTYTVQIPTAISMSLHAPRFQLPPTATLTVAGSRGQVTYRQADASRGGLWTRPLIGDTLTLSLVVAAAEVSQVHLEIQTLQAGYRSLGAGVENHPRLKKLLAAKDTPATGSCTENYSCHATSTNSGPAAATVAILVGNVGQCTGTLLSDVRADNTPYVLTARHCETGDLGGGRPDAAGSVIVLWDAVSPCSGALGSLYDGGLKTQSGAVTMVEQQDIWLIKLDSPVAADDPYYSGWDATGGVFTGGYSIHHALGLNKQYVEWSGQAILETIPGTTLKVGYDSHFWGLVNSMGNVGAGASGGAVFDGNNNVVGSASLAALVGGEGTAGVCPVNPVPAPSPASATALYTALASVWTSTADTTSSTGNVTLQSLLDPDGTGHLVNAGYGVVPMTLTATNTSPTTFQNTTLTWSAPGTDSCTASGGVSGDGWNGSKPASGSIQLNELAGTDVVYSINCVGKNEVAQASVRVTWIYIAPYVDLHADPGPVMAGGIVYLFWSSNVSACTATGGLSGDGWAGAKTSASGNGSQDITVNQIGTVTYTLTCGSGARVATANLPVSIVAPGVTMYADTTRITAAAGLAGSYVNLHWVGSGTGGTNCVSSGGRPGDNWNFAGNTGSSGSDIISESVPGTYTYTMTCTGGGQTATSSVSVQFTNEAPAISLTAIHPTQEIFPPTATNDQGTPNLAWTSNVNGCFLISVGNDNDSTGVDLHGQYPSGTASAVARIASHYVYTLTCPGGLQASASIDWVTSNPQITIDVPTTSWVANLPYQISYTTNTSPCVESGGAAGDGWGGASGVHVGNTVTETAPGSYTFIVTCGTGSSTAHSQVTATVAPPGVTISSSVANVPVGQTFTLMWDSSIAPCTSIVAGSVNWGGNSVYPNGTLTEIPIDPGTYTYSIVCGSGSQTVQASTQVVVSKQVATSIAANVVSADVSSPVVLTWTAPDSAVCTASGGDGLDGWGGPIPSSGTATVTGHQASMVAYAISCSGIMASAAVTYTNATAAAVPHPSASLSTDATSAATGHSVTLNWDGENSAQCIASGGNSTDGWNGTLPTSGSRSVTESTEGSYTYMVTCTGAPPASMAKITVKYSGDTGSTSAGSGSSSGGSGGGGGAFLPVWLWLLLIPATVRVVSRFYAHRQAPEC